MRFLPSVIGNRTMLCEASPTHLPVTRAGGEGYAIPVSDTGSQRGTHLLL